MNFDHCMNFDHNLIINQLLFYEVYQLFVAPRAKDQSNFDLVWSEIVSVIQRGALKNNCIELGVKQMDAKLLTSEFTILRIDLPKVLLVSSYLLIYWGANGICICTLFEVKIFSEMKRKSFHAK